VEQAATQKHTTKVDCHGTRCSRQANCRNRRAALRVRGRGHAAAAFERLRAACKQHCTQQDSSGSSLQWFAVGLLTLPPVSLVRLLLLVVVHECWLQRHVLISEMQCNRMTWQTQRCCRENANNSAAAGAPLAVHRPPTCHHKQARPSHCCLLLPPSRRARPGSRALGARQAAGTRHQAPP
jgi:hypothetical protein